MNEDTKDCARLPVVAWQVEFPLGNGAKVYEQRPSWAYESYGDLAYVTHELCRLTDAQARLAEKDARIAQLAAHARGKNKALANALKEIERLKTISDNYCALLMDANQKLQSAPAERGVFFFDYMHPRSGEKRTVSMTWKEIADDMVDVLFDKLCAEICQCEPLGETSVVDCNCCDYADDFDLILNPAPATADSDVREVKK